METLKYITSAFLVTYFLIVGLFFASFPFWAWAVMEIQDGIKYVDLLWYFMVHLLALVGGITIIFITIKAIKEHD